MKSKALLYISITFYLFSCNSNEKINDTYRSLPLSLTQEEAPINVSEIVDSMVVVPIEPNDGSIIGNVDKIIITDRHYIIADREGASSVYVFDKNGLFCGTVGRKGHAANEHIELTDVATDGCHIYILDSYSNKVRSYSVDGKFIQAFDMPYAAHFFKYLSDMKFAFTSDFISNESLVKGASAPNLFIYDFETNEVEGDMYFNVSRSPEAFPVLVDNLNPYFRQPLDFCIYDVTEKGSHLLAIYDVPKRYIGNLTEFIDRAEKENLKAVDYEEWKSSFPFPEIVSFFDCGNYYFSFIVNDGWMYYVLHDLKTGSSIEASSQKGLPFVNDIYPSIPIIPQAVSDGILYCVAPIECVPDELLFESKQHGATFCLVKLYMKSNLSRN